MHTKQGIILLSYLPSYFVLKEVVMGSFSTYEITNDHIKKSEIN